MRIKKVNFSPPQVIVLGFALIILFGALLLMLPISNINGEFLPFIDAFFTSVSATTVTGLEVVDTGTAFSWFGQVIILLLIQIGGLGFMTTATLVALVFKRKISLKERLLLQEAMNQGSMEGIVRLVRRVLFYALVIESAAAVLYAIRFAFDMPFGRALYFGVFHAISMFNNSGFDLFGNYRSLMMYTADPAVNLLTMFLIITGGLGFIVISDLMDYRNRRRLTLHSKVVLTMSGFLILSGALVILVFEFTNKNTLGSLDWSGKLWSAFFQSVAPRTAGAHTLDISSLRQATQFFILILMFIGASPSSTGGGIKTTTFMILLGAVVSMIRGRSELVLFRYRLAQERIFKAVTVTMLALFLVIGVALILSTTERGASFLSILFETTSAFGNVGLSMGITGDLSAASKLILSFTMFTGRLGLLTLAYALGPKRGKRLYRHPEGKMIIG